MTPTGIRLASNAKSIKAENRPAVYNYVSPGYFHTLGTRLVAGRDFTWTDLYNLSPRVIVSENFARENLGFAFSRHR